MIFTVVTIVFLPLSFMSSFYALSVDEFPRDPSNQNQLYMPLSYVTSRVLGIGFGIAILIVALGFIINYSITGFPTVRWLPSRNRPNSLKGGSSKKSLENAEHKVFTAERTPLRETASVISWTSYTPKRVTGDSGESKSSILSQLLHFSRQNTGEVMKDKEMKKVATV